MRLIADLWVYKELWILARQIFAFEIYSIRKAGGIFVKIIEN
jgi:hypothetical protein